MSYEQVKNENEKKKKECNPNEHCFMGVQKSALIPLSDGSGLGFKTWECQTCDKKVKSS